MTAALSSVIQDSGAPFLAKQAVWSDKEDRHHSRIGDEVAHSGRPKPDHKRLDNAKDQADNYAAAHVPDASDDQYHQALQTQQLTHVGIGRTESDSVQDSSHAGERGTHGEAQHHYLLHIDANTLSKLRALRYHTDRLSRPSAPQEKHHSYRQPG